MTCPTRSSRWLALLASCLMIPLASFAQDPAGPKPKADDKAQAPAKPLRPGEFPDQVPLPPPSPWDGAGIKPLPPVAIPDDPPPHEGAFFDIPLTIEPPDIIIVEVLEAMPGRPITGERLVRPDGTISLGFYGDVHVRGLTPEQAKVKIVHHLRKYVTDEVLGLVSFVPDPDAGGAMPEGGRPPVEPNPIVEKKADKITNEDPPAEKKPETEAKPAGSKEGRPSASASRKARKGRRLALRTAQVPRAIVPGSDHPDSPKAGQVPVQKPEAEGVMVEVEEIPAQGRMVVIQAADSNHVFVDFSAHNSKVYFVQGDVGVPGRLPFTGGETVLDALNYSGGFVPSAEPTDIHLYRPARGGKPSKDYKIDIQAIQRGDASANLQLFPNDRLVVGRNAIVKKTVELDRAAAPINALFHSILSYAFASRTLGATSTTTTTTVGPDTTQIKVGGQNLALNLADPAMTPARRDALIKEWFEFYWSISGKDGGAMLDEKAFRDALMKKLTTEPK